ncbi:MAG: DUF454 domain-containing protein [Candidatus Brocadiaceae bacterium]|nr:DUF454 domain-containing protein [Candidatus Brocadiaceae bacterium]
MPASGARKWLLVAAGCTAVALGAVGVVLPVLPTTPFLLLAAACFVRSSDRLYRWLIRHRWFGSYIRNYREHRAVTRRAKMVVVTLLWLTLGYSMVVVGALWLRLLLAVIGLCVTIHVVGLKTAPPATQAGGAAGPGPGERPAPPA